MALSCPKCGREADAGALICSGCDYILDATFLGDDITDDERERRPGTQESRRFGKKKAGIDFGEDAMILGDVNDVEVSSFQSRDAGVSQREVTQTRFYIGGGLAQLMEANAIPEMAAGVSGASIRMTPFERHVLGFVNGRRSVGRIQKKSAMDESEFKTALAMLADKGFIRLKGWKKPKVSSSVADSMTGSKLSGAPSLAHRAPEGERTVVASMEHIEALARQKKALDDARAPKRGSTEGRPASGNVPQVSSQADTPAMPSPEVATVVAPAPSAEALGLKSFQEKSRPKDSPLSRTDDIVPSRRFASLQANVPTSDSESARRRLIEPDARDVDDDSNVKDVKDFDPDGFDDGDGDRAAEITGKVEDDVVDPLAAAAQVWDDTSNQSSVFADSDADPAPVVATPAGRHPMADAPDDGGNGNDGALVDDAAAGFDGFDGATGGFEALRDPTGLGDSFLGDDDNRGGAPIDDEDDGEADDDAGSLGDDDDDDDEDDVGFVSAEAIADAKSAASADDDDDDELGPPRRIHDEVTAAPPRGASDRAEADDVGDDEDVNPTRQLEAPRPMTLPSEALSPVVVEPPAPLPLPGQAPLSPALSMAPTAPSASVPRPTATLPGQAAPDEAPAPPPMLALPGQALVKPGDAPLPHQPAATPAVKPAAPTRVSAASQVPFELRKKAERIYEQALKDHAEGRLSSALMNAKLATNFDSTVDAYREFFEALNKEKAAPKGPRPQELVLFVQASEAEGKGDYNRAVTLLQQALAISPKAAALHNRLGVILSIRLKQHDEALKHLKLAIELEPGSIVYMNNFSKVTGLLESMLEKDPKKYKRGAAQGDEKVAVKKIRPKLF